MEIVVQSGQVQNFASPRYVVALAAAVGAHVQVCFSAERAHCDALAALAEIEGYGITAGWPA